MKLSEVKDQFTLKIKLGSDVFVHCHYKRGAKMNDGYVCYLMEIAVVVGMIIISRHKCGGSELWMNENMSVE